MFDTFLKNVTPLDIAKKSVNLAFGAAVTKYTRRAMLDRDRFEEDDITVNYVPNALGMTAAMMCKARTDALIDRAASWHAERKTAQTTNTPEVPTPS